MARVHLKLAASDPFTTLANGQLLSVDPNWTQRKVGVTFREDETLDRIEAMFSATWGMYDHSYAPPLVNYTVWGKFGAHEIAPDVGDYIGLAARVNASGGGFDWYGFTYWRRSGAGPKKDLTLYRFDVGVATSLGNYVCPTALVEGDELCLEVVTNGAGNVVVKGYLNDAEVISATDASADKITAAGTGGVMGLAGAGPYYPAWLEWRVYEGNVSPNGTYAWDGVTKIGDKPVYARDDAWSIWRDSGNSRWVLSKVAGETGAGYWTLAGDSATGTYTPAGTASGNPVVTVAT